MRKALSVILISAAVVFSGLAFSAQFTDKMAIGKKTVDHGVLDVNGEVYANSYNGDGSALTGMTKTQVGLGNVDNTSDLNKPISTATQTALNGKEPTLTKGDLSGSTGISVTGGTGAVIGAGTTITNTAPDQTVAITAGTGIGVSGTYPNFTISNTASGSTDHSSLSNLDYASAGHTGFQPAGDYLTSVNWSQGTELNMDGINWDDMQRVGDYALVNWSEGNIVNMDGINWDAYDNANVVINWSEVPNYEADPFSLHLANEANNVTGGTFDLTTTGSLSAGGFISSGAYQFRSPSSVVSSIFEVWQYGGVGEYGWRMLFDDEGSPSGDLTLQKVYTFNNDPPTYTDIVTIDRDYEKVKILGSGGLYVSAGIFDNTSPTPVVSIDPNMRTLLDASGNNSVDYGQHFLQDASGNFAEDWQNRILYASDGTTSMVNYAANTALQLMPASGNVLIGTVSDDTINKLQVLGQTKSTDYITDGTSSGVDVTGLALNTSFVGSVIGSGGWSGEGFAFSNLNTGSKVFGLIYNEDTAWFGSATDGATWFLGSSDLTNAAYAVGAMATGMFQANDLVYSNTVATDTVFQGGIVADSANFVGSEGYWAIRTGTDYSYNIDVNNSATPITAFRTFQNGNVLVGNDPVWGNADFGAGYTLQVRGGYGYQALSSTDGVGYRARYYDGDRDRDLNFYYDYTSDLFYLYTGIPGIGYGNLKIGASTLTFNDQEGMYNILMGQGVSDDGVNLLQVQGNLRLNTALSTDGSNYSYGTGIFGSVYVPGAWSGNGFLFSNSDGGHGLGVATYNNDQWYFGHINADNSAYNYMIMSQTQMDFQSMYAFFNGDCGLIFRDSSIHIESLDDGYMDFAADAGFRFNGGQPISFDQGLLSTDGSGNLTGASFITTGGASTDFVKGDGTLDGTTYADVTTTPQIEIGTSAPSSTPTKVGDIYVDTSNKKLYFATGTGSSSDWTIAN